MREKCSADPVRTATIKRGGKAFSCGVSAELHLCRMQVQAIGCNN